MLTDNQNISEELQSPHKIICRITKRRMEKFNCFSPFKISPSEWISYIITVSFNPLIHNVLKWSDIL